MLSIWSNGLVPSPHLIRGSRKQIYNMSNIKLSQSTPHIILFAAQVIAVYIVISFSLYSQTQTTENIEL